MLRYRFASLFLATAALAHPGPLQAQSLLGDTPVATAPPADGAARPIESILAASPLRQPMPERANRARILSFEQAAGRMRLEGEFDTSRLTFTLDPASVAEGGDLVIAYKNAVSVMPEGSTLSVRVNGTPAGAFALRSPSGEDTRSLTIPPALLRAGVNEVVIETIQRHRVDCSMEATYELWTEIDASRSGFRPNRERPMTGFNALRTIARAPGAATDLRLVLNEGAGAAALEMAAPAVQLAVLALNRDDVAVSVADRAGTGPGIDLFVATDDDPVSVMGMPQGAPYGFSVLPGADSQRASIVLRASSARDVQGMLLAAIGGPLKGELDTGIRAPRGGEIRGAPASIYTLADAGYEAKPFAGRLFRTRLDLVLPADFYPAEYATLDLALHAATSPGLKPTSQFLVRVNGHIVKSLPIRDTAGEVFDGRRMELPLRAFRPGRNQVELLAELEKASDDRCVFSERDETQPRFILLDTTEIRIPALARVTRLPELSAMAGAAWPQAQSGPVTFNLIRPDSRAVSAALTMMAKLVTAARAPLQVRFAFGAISGEGENTIVVATSRSVDEIGRLGSGMPGATGQEIQFANPRRTDAAADPIQTASIALPGAALLPAGQNLDPEALLQAFRQTARDMGEGRASLAARLSTGFSGAFERFLLWMNYQRPADMTIQNTSGPKATLSQRPSVTGRGTVTWLTADQPSDLARASEILARPEVWGRIEGEAVTFDLESGTVASQRPSSYFDHRIDDWSVGNIRRIVAAWFSDHFRIYVAAVLALMAVFAVVTGRAIPKMGVRTDQ